MFAFLAIGNFSILKIFTMQPEMGGWCLICDNNGSEKISYIYISSYKTLLVTFPRNIKLMSEKYPNKIYNTFLHIYLKGFSGIMLTICMNDQDLSAE